MALLFQKKGTTIELNKLGDDCFRLSMQKSTSQGASEELTKAELEQLLDAGIRALVATPEPDRSQRTQAVTKTLRAYAEETDSTLEKLDKEIASTQVYDKAVGKKRAMTREEWLSELLGAEDLEEVLAGKMSLSEALADVEELEEATLTEDPSAGDDGDSLRA